MFNSLDSLFGVFFVSAHDTVLAEQVYYVWPLVVLSFITTSVGASTGLSVVREIFESNNVKAKKYLHFYAAFVFGAGMWVMHFVSMLSHDMQINFSYPPLLTIILIFCVSVISYSFIAIIRHSNLSVTTCFLGALLMTSAILMMHYISLYTMDMKTDVLYDPRLFFASFLIAAFASAISIFCMFQLKTQKKKKIFWHLCTSIIIGTAIFLTHFIGMKAAIFLPLESCCTNIDKGNINYISGSNIVIVSIFIVALITRVLFWKKGYLNSKETLWNYIPKIILLLGIIITALDIVAFNNSHENEDNARFSALIKEVENHLMVEYSTHSETPYGAQTLFLGAPHVNNHEIAYAIYQNQNINEENAIYRHPKYVTEYLKGQRRKADTVQIANQEWLIQWQTTPSFQSSFNNILMFKQMAIGTIITVLLAIVAHTQNTRTKTVQRYVEERTKELRAERQFSELVINTIPDYIFVKDRDSKIIKTNDAFLKLYPEESRQEIVGGIGIEGHDQKSVDLYLSEDKKAFEQGFTKAYETIQIYDGSTVKLDTTKVTCPL